MCGKSNPRLYCRPLIPILLSYGCGIVGAVYVHDIPGISWMFFGAFALCLWVAARTRAARFLPIVLFFILGYWNLHNAIAPDLAPNHISRFVDDKPWHIIGTVRRPPQLTPGHTRFTLDAELLSRGGKTYDVTGGVRVSAAGPFETLKKGDRICFFSRLKEIWNFNNPGGFDYRRYMAFRGIGVSAFVSNRNLLITLHPTQANFFCQAIERVRQAMSELLKELPPQDSRAVLKALVIGDRSEISSCTRQTLSRIGTSHLLAISGLHVGMVATFAFLFFKLLLSRFERVLLAAWGVRGAALLSSVPVLFYGFLAGMSPSTQRAVIMVMAFQLALVLRQEHDSMNTLALAAFIILIASPAALFEISFQLSFAAVCSILCILRYFSPASGQKPSPYRPFRRLTIFMLVSCAAIAGTLPLTLYYFNQVSLVAPITNCLMIPLVGFVVVPLGLLAVLFVLICPALSLWLARGAMAALQVGLGLADLCARFPYAAVTIVAPSLLEIVLYYAWAWIIMRFRSSRFARIALLAVAVITLADVAYWAAKRFGNEDLKVTVIDVGQGQAVLMELPGGKCMLVDGGGFYQNRFDVGQRVIAPFLWKKKIATVENLVLSHPHPDHLNGLLYIARHFNVQELWTNKEGGHSEIYQDLIHTTSQKGIRVLGPKALSAPRNIENVRFQILYPPADFVQRKQHEPWRTTNNNSLVLKVTFGHVSFLLPGDIEAEAEGELTSLAADALACDVLVVPHHGSQTSSTTRFLNITDPTIAVISVGRNNPSGLPHSKVLARLKAHGYQIYRTDLQGAITLITDGTHIKIVSQHEFP